MKELSIFVDESGDFGEYDYRAPYYIISMVLHDQEKDILPDLKKLENHQLSKSEMHFFGDERTLKKNYLKPLARKEII